MKQHSLKNKIASLLSREPKLRDNDKLLWLKIAEEHGLVLSPKQRIIFMQIPSEGSVGRRRRELSKDYPASKEATDRRFRNYKRYVIEFSNQSWLKRILKKRGIV